MNPSALTPVTHPSVIILSFLIILSGLGCGNGRLPTYPVTGKVVFTDGAPVRTGFIELLSDDHGINARGTIERDGTFRLMTYEPNDGAVAGGHRAVIVQFLAQENLPAIQHDHGAPVSLKYTDYVTSGLTLVVEPHRDNAWEVVVEVAN